MPSGVERAPSLHAISAKVAPLELTAGNAAGHRESRGAAAHGKTSEHVGRELIIETARQTPGLMRQRGTADVGLTIKLPAAVKTGGPCAPAGLVDRWRFHNRTQGVAF